MEPIRLFCPVRQWTVESGKELVQCMGESTRQQQWPSAGLHAIDVLERHGCCLLVGADYMSPNFHCTCPPLPPPSPHPSGWIWSVSCHLLITEDDLTCHHQTAGHRTLPDKSNNAHSCDPGIAHIIWPARSFSGPLSQFQHSDRIAFSLPRAHSKRSYQQDLHPDPLLNDGDHDSIFAISAIIAWNAAEWIILEHFRRVVSRERSSRRGRGGWK